MKLDLAEILANPGMRYKYDVAEPAIVDEDLECTQPIEGQLTFTNTGNVLLIEGIARTKIAVPCSRCIVDFEEPVEAPISEGFPLDLSGVTHGGRRGYVRVEEDENPSAIRLFEGHLLDLTELLRQNVTLQIPLQPLHDPLCKGLCAICGADLNEGACGCRHEPSNPVLAKLAALLEKED